MITGTLYVPPARAGWRSIVRGSSATPPTVLLHNARIQHLTGHGGIPEGPAPTAGREVIPTRRSRLGG